MSNQSSFVCEFTSRERKSRAHRFGVYCPCCRGNLRPGYSLPKDLSHLKSEKARRAKAKSKD